MRPRHRRQRQLQLREPDHGEIPDGGARRGPDGWGDSDPLPSGMSAKTESGGLPFVEMEYEWTDMTVVETRSNSFAPSHGWRPSLNAYRCADHFVVFVELAGVAAASVEVSAQARRVTIRGTRPAPEPGCRRSDLAQLLALEIDQGSFERSLDLPQDIDPAQMTSECRDGLLRIHLPLAG